MSRVGRLPIEIPQNVTARIEGGNLFVSGNKGQLSLALGNKIDVSLAENKIVVSAQKDDKFTKAVFGTTRSIIANMVYGVDKGWERQLELSGVGYRASVQGDKLVLELGFSHPVEVKAPENVRFVVNEEKITISGVDKEVVSELAARIRRIKPPEPYKGKGIKYLNEKIRRKVGKAAKAAAAPTVK